MRNSLIISNVLNSPIDYLKGQLCPFFYACKSGSYVHNTLIFRYLGEFTSRFYTTLYDVICTFMTKNGITCIILSNYKLIPYG